MVEFGNEATVQSDLLRSILTVQIDLDKQHEIQEVEGRKCSPGVAAHSTYFFKLFL